jgi:hypothetical protein
MYSSLLISIVGIQRWIIIHMAYDNMYKFIGYTWSVPSLSLKGRATRIDDVASAVLDAALYLDMEALEG